MTEYGAPFDGILIGDATVAPYSATEWAAREAMLHGVGVTFPNYGVLEGTGDGSNEVLNVRANSPASSSIIVEIGAALVNGRLYETTAAVTLTVGANASGNARIDTVILRADYVAQTVRLILKQGTPAASPVRPTLQQDTSIWEIPLADIAVANGFSVINTADVLDRRRTVHSLSNSWLPFAYPTLYLFNGNYDGGGIGFSSSAVVAVPFIIAANMLVQSITLRIVVGGLTTTVISCAIYKQDVNDKDSAENTLRRIALTDFGSLNINTGNNTFTFNPAPIFLSPGLYWVTLKNAGGAVCTLGGVAPTGGSFFAQNSYQSIIGATLGTTLDFVTGWTKQNGVLGIRLNGRVFGETTVF